MSYILIVLLILAILGIFLFAHRLSVRDRQERKLRSQTSSMAMKANDVWDAAERASGYIDAPDIFEAIIDYYIDIIRRRHDILAQQDTENLISEAEEYKSKLRSKSAVTELKNDQEINHAKRAFSQTSKYLRAALNRKIISGQACVNMRNSLRLRLLNLEVSAYERLGDASGGKQDPAMATTYYKYAKKLLIESDLKFEGKNEWVRDITSKTQALFGKTVSDHLSKGLEKEEKKVDKHGIPLDLDAMSGNKKRF